MLPLLITTFLNFSMVGFFKMMSAKKKVITLRFNLSLFVNRTIVLFFLFTTYVQGEAFRDVNLQAIILPGAPKILKDKKIMYGLDLVFGKKPKDYWIYYNKLKKKLVIDFYGVHIKGKPKVDFSGRGIFTSYEVVNSETKLSLSKKQARVLIGLEPDPEWHFKSDVIDNRIIRITAWKDITPLTKVGEKKRRFWPYVLLVILGASVTFGVIMAINKYINNAD